MGFFSFKSLYLTLRLKYSLSILKNKPTWIQLLLKPNLVKCFSLSFSHLVIVESIDLQNENTWQLCYPTRLQCPYFAINCLILIDNIVVRLPPSSIHIVLINFIAIQINYGKCLICAFKLTSIFKILKNWYQLSLKNVSFLTIAKNLFYF